jgi:predicted AlkP superfamily phosphohydrolase/phosphomutase
MGKPKKTVLIGIDGGDWRLIGPWIESGYLKHLGELVESGVRATLLSTIPPFTLPAWSSIFTGVNPGKHGITDNLLRIGNKLVPARSRYREAPLIWKVLSHHGFKSIVLNDPVTYPPEPINGIMVTGFLTPFNSSFYAFPSEIKDEVDKVSGGYMPELPSDYDKMIAKDRISAFNYISFFAQKTASLALYMIKNYEWDVFNVTFTSTDRLQHFYWQDRHILREHYIWLDSIIGKLVNEASIEEANVVIVSDHGFMPIYRSVYINTLLAEKGLTSSSKSPLQIIKDKIGLNTEDIMSFLKFLKIDNIVSKFALKYFRHILSSKSTMNRQSIARLQTAAGIFIEQTLCKNYNTVRDFIFYKLLILKDYDRKVVSKVFKRDEVLWGPFVHRAPDLIVIPNEGYYLSTEVKEKVFGRPIQSTSKVLRSGDHRVQGIFIAYGPEVSRGVHLNEPLFTWDVAPLVLHILNLPVLSYMDGRVRKEIFKEGSEPAVNPVKYEDVAAREWVRARLKKLKGDRLGAK